MTEVRYRCRRCPEVMQPYRPGRYERACPACGGMLMPYVHREGLDPYEVGSLRAAMIDSDGLLSIFEQIDKMRGRRRSIDAHS